MLCPECKQSLTEKEVITSDNQKALIYECFNCGGHFFPHGRQPSPQVTAQDVDSITPKILSPPIQPLFVRFVRKQ